MSIFCDQIHLSHEMKQMFAVVGHSELFINLLVCSWFLFGGFWNGPPHPWAVRVENQNFDLGLTGVPLGNFFGAAIKFPSFWYDWNIEPHCVERITKETPETKGMFPRSFLCALRQSSFCVKKGETRNWEGNNTSLQFVFVVVSWRSLTEPEPVWCVL